MYASRSDRSTGTGDQLLRNAFGSVSDHLRSSLDPKAPWRNDQATQNATPSTGRPDAPSLIAVCGYQSQEPSWSWTHNHQVFS